MKLSKRKHDSIEFIVVTTHDDRNVKNLTDYMWSQGLVIDNLKETMIADSKTKEPVYPVYLVYASGRAYDYGLFKGFMLKKGAWESTYDGRECLFL